MRSSFGPSKLAALAAGAFLASASAAMAAPVVWTDWTAADADSASGSVNGVSVTFTGALNPAAQVAGGTNYWATNPATYTAPPVVDNGPPDSDIIRLTGGAAAGVQTLTFAAPLINPVMAILSLGQAGAPVVYDFDAAFDILSNGPGFFGAGPLTELPGDMLEGREGHGLIQFAGTLSSISWTIPNGEFWHGFTIGVAGAAGPTPTPEPEAALLLATGCALLLVARSRRRRAGS
jgi:hypothetical protein